MKKIIIKFYIYCIKIRVLSRTSLMFLWELKNTIISQNLRELCVIKINTNIPHIVASTSSATNYFITRCLSLLKAHSHFSSRCLSLSKAHYFYCIKIRVLYRTSLMFLWELKNAIISTTLRELCDIKNPPTMASTSSATNYSITRCLSLSKAASKKHHNFITSSPRKIPHTVASTSSATNYSITSCLSL